MKATKLGRWLAAVAAIELVIVPFLASSPVRGDSSLRASLDYSILAEPYQNSVELNFSGLDTRIAVDRDPSSPYYGTIYAVSGGQSGFAVQRSQDGGRTFSLASTVPLCSVSDTSCAFSPPDIAVGPHGLVYVVIGDTIFRSGDEASSWRAIAVFSAFGGSTSLSSEPRPSIATDNATGTIYVVDVNSSAVVLLTKSMDGGDTWSRPVAISGGATAATPHVAALHDDVAVAFLSSGDASCGPGECAYVSIGTSHDGGATWPNVTAVSPPKLSNATSPSVTVSSDGVFAASWYFAVAADTGATFVSISRDRASTFSAPIEVSRYPGVPYVGFGDALIFDNDSRLYVTWQAFGPAPNGTYAGGYVYVGSSADLGQNFTNASFSFSLEGRGTNGSSYEHLAGGLDDHVYLTWFDFRGGHALFRSVAGEAAGDVVPSSQFASGTLADVELVDNVTGVVQARATWTGSPLRFDELPPTLYAVWIQVGSASARAGTMPVQTWNTTVFTVNVETVPVAPGASLSPWITAAGIGGIVVFAAAALLAFQHTRLAREEILQRKVRLLMYDKIRGDPGSSFTEVRDALGLKNGVAAYHLGVLEKQGLVHTEKGRRHRWYYPNGDVSLWRDLPLSPLQRSLVDQVRQAPGIGIRELARTVNRHHASVAYNVKGLVREGVLRTERSGRKVCCFPKEGGDVT